MAGIHSSEGLKSNVTYGELSIKNFSLSKMTILQDEFKDLHTEDINGWFLVETKHLRMISFTSKPDETGAISFSVTVKDAEVFKKFVEVLRRNNINYRLDRDSQSIISSTSERVLKTLN